MNTTSVRWEVYPNVDRRWVSSRMGFISGSESASAPSRCISNGRDQIGSQVEERGETLTPEVNCLE